MQFTIVSIIALAFGALFAQAAPVQRPEDLAVRTPAEVSIVTLTQAQQDLIQAAFSDYPGGRGSRVQALRVLLIGNFIPQPFNPCAVLTGAYSQTFCTGPKTTPQR
ncbi:hypothetical protein C8R46DRAFT_1034582 [Mycena filopes]|nr:hypothetical protein C8R46DRAFT_1034582 [Mycena filopes]